MNFYLTSIGYFILCGLYLQRMRFSTELPNRILFKVLPIAILVGCTLEYMKQRHTLAIKNSSFPPRIYSLVGGFIFHILSSIYYEFRSLNLYGILCYVVALSVEIYGYSTVLEPVMGFRNEQEMAVLGTMCVVSISVYLYVLPKLNLTNAVLVFLFSSLDTLLFFVLTVHAMRFPYGPHYLGAVGAGIRYLSDVVNVVTIWRINFRYSFQTVLVLYYSAQLAIALSVLLPITL